MPIYEFTCSKGHRFERLQSAGDPLPKVCPEAECRSRTIERTLSSFTPRFLGSGFHNTDYGKNKKEKKARGKKQAKDKSVAAKTDVG